jgi:hypothetical protein
LLQYLPYSPILVPCDIFMFRKLKISFSEPNFESLEDILNKMTVLKRLSEIISTDLS